MSNSYEGRGDWHVIWGREIRQLIRGRGTRKGDGYFIREVRKVVHGMSGKWTVLFGSGHWVFIIQSGRVVGPFPPRRGTPTESPPSVQHPRGSVRSVKVRQKQLQGIDKSSYEVVITSYDSFEKGCG